MWIATDGEARALSRRRFLGMSATAVAGLVVLPGCGESKTGGAGHAAAKSGPGRKGFILGPGKDTNVRTGEHRYYLAFVDLDVDPPQAKRAALSFFGHGLVPHPIHRERLAVFEKRGKGACEFDLSTGQVIRTIETVKTRQFYGHGAFTGDGKLCFATESDLVDDYRGVVAVRDAATMEIVSEFPSFGTAPHDCVLVDGGKTMVITNGGDPPGGDSAPAVTFIDMKKRELVDKIEFDTPRINAGHVAVAANGDVAVVSAPREGVHEGTGALTLRPVGEPAHTVTEPAEITSRMNLETLSVAIHEPKGLVGATNPAGDIVTFWRMRDRSYVGKFEVKFPRGIVLTEDGREFVISHGKPERYLTRLDVATLEPVAGGRDIACGIGGSHLINYRYDA